MKGQFAITKEDNISDIRYYLEFFRIYKSSLKHDPRDPTLGWYAYGLFDNIYYFKYCDKADRPSDRCLKSLANDGWCIT